MVMDNTMDITPIPKRFDFFEHTADIGIIAYGNTMEEAFANIAYGMFTLLAETDNITNRKSIDISITAYNQDEVLVGFLSELLYHSSVKQMVFNKVAVLELTPTSIHAKAYGEKFTPDKHQLLQEIKTVTYHQLRIEDTGCGWEIQVIFDV
ncbi:archease [Candidatus Desantisbacteria bacterium]|nr:archease [Candidatus Desantisbacteria bacterium]